MSTSIVICETVILNCETTLLLNDNRQDSPTESVVDVEFYSICGITNRTTKRWYLKVYLYKYLLHYTDMVKRASFCKCILLNVNAMGVLNM